MKHSKKFLPFAAVALMAGCATLGTQSETGFVPLFNGKDLTGWNLVGKKGDGYGVKDGVIYCAKGGGGNLLSEKQYANFVLRFEFKLESASNNGIGIRAPLTDKQIAYEGMEIQVLGYGYDKPLKPEQYHGSIYNLVPAKHDLLKPPGEWNTQEIVADGRRIRVTVNGKLAVEADLNTITDLEKIAKHPGLLREAGHVGFLGHNDYCEFRNVRLKELPDNHKLGSPLASPNVPRNGFKPLFDGKTLAGWKGLLARPNDNPSKREVLGATQLTMEQIKADVLMRDTWKVEDGALVYRGKGFNNLVSARPYANFELFCDWRIEKAGDSGLYLRGVPQVQIWDTLAEDRNQVGSGGLFNNKKTASTPALRADYLTGEWNRFQIVMIGDKVTIWLNGQKVVANTPLENYWEKDKPLYASGPIELQAHNSPVWFKNVFVRELPAGAAK